MLCKQLLRSGTSIGANIREAENAESKKGFIHKMTNDQKEIELIKEYKEAMISEAVLGKFNYKILKS